MIPYAEDEHKRYNREEVIAAYQKKGRALDADFAIWSARVERDVCEKGMSYSASEAKHTRELYAELGLDMPEPAIVTLPGLVRVGRVFALETGEPWTAIECSDFNLFARFQHEGPDAAEPIFDQREEAGFNLLRVWSLFNLPANPAKNDPGIGVLLDPDYGLMPKFMQAAARHGLYVEWTAYTSTEWPDHWQQLVAAVRQEANRLLELVNEGDDPRNAIDFSRYGKPDDVLCSRGSSGSEGVPPWGAWDYGTYHTNGADQEQRKCGHNAMEDLADPLRIPVITNETSRFPDVGMWRGASDQRCQDLAFDAAAGAALLCAGSCFHSVQGKNSTLWDARTLEVAKAWVRGAKSVPLSAQHQPYKRRDDLLRPGLLRVYQRGTSDAAIVAIRE